MGKNQIPRSIERISSIHEKHILALWRPLLPYGYMNTYKVV